MVTLKRVKSEADLKPLTNRVVCDVCEARHESLYGEFVNWRGSTETEYFSVIFLKGVMTLSIDERECRVGTDPINIAMSAKLADYIASAKSNLEQAGLANKYSRENYPKELKDVSFTDVMVLLGWKYAPNAKIDYNPFTP